MNALKKGFRIARIAALLCAIALMGVGASLVFGSGPWPWIVCGVCTATVASYFKGERYVERRVGQALAHVRKGEPEIVSVSSCQI